MFCELHLVLEVVMLKGTKQIFFMPLNMKKIHLHYF